MTRTGQERPLWSGSLDGRGVKTESVTKVTMRVCVGASVRNAFSHFLSKVHLQNRVDDESRARAVPICKRTKAKQVDELVTTIEDEMCGRLRNRSSL